MIDNSTSTLRLLLPVTSPSSPLNGPSSTRTLSPTPNLSNRTNPSSPRRLFSSSITSSSTAPGRSPFISSPLTPLVPVIGHHRYRSNNTNRYLGNNGRTPFRV